MKQQKMLTTRALPNLEFVKKNYPNVKALFFDMDGTLFDTEKFHAQALTLIGKTHGIIPPVGPQEVYNLMVGKADHLLFEIIRDWKNFPSDWNVKDFVDEKNKNLMKILSSLGPHDFFPIEFRGFLKDLRQEKFYTALVTSSEKVITDQLLELTDLKDSFDLKLTRDDCPKHKPDPWPYLNALTRSGHHALETLIFEDSEVGLTAARLSGAHYVKAEWY